MKKEFAEAVVQSCSVKKVFLKTRRPATLLKRDSNTCVPLQTLRALKKNLI